MTTQSTVSGVEATQSSGAAAALFSRSMASIARLMKTWFDTCADYYEAASLYDELSRLSDAELRKRGLSRDSIARDVCASCDRAALQ